MFNINNMEFNQKEGEDDVAYVNRLCPLAENSIANLKQIEMYMRKDGVVGLCKKCKCNLYLDKKHIC